MALINISAIMLAIALALSGCAAPQSTREQLAREHLANARAAYTIVKADPRVEANAPMALADAQQTLEAAAQARNFDEINHLAYLAERQTHIAAAMARIEIARQKSAGLRRENNQLIEQLSARARQAEDPQAAQREERAAAQEDRPEGASQRY